MDLVEKELQFITANNLIKNGDTLVVGVSGGPDSVALLDVLFRLKFKLGVNLKIAHYNHRLRPDADKDEAFVKALANKLNLSFYVGRRKGSGKFKLVSEETARKWRFNFFLKIIKRLKADGIVLAHTQNDLAETVLMRLLRGAGLSGLRGILREQQVREIKIIRPFLSTSRQEIERYLKIRKLKYCIDETNTQTHYLRNKIRLKLLPSLIKEYNPNLSEVLIDLAKSSQADYDFLYIQAKNLFDKNAKISRNFIEFRLNFFIKQHISMRRMLLRLAFECLVGDLNQLSFKHIQEAEDLLFYRPIGSQVHWPKLVTVKKLKGTLGLTVT